MRKFILTSAAAVTLALAGAMPAAATLLSPGHAAPATQSASAPTVQKVTWYKYKRRHHLKRYGWNRHQNWRTHRYGAYRRYDDRRYGHYRSWRPQLRFWTHQQRRHRW